jgi:CHASE3 domain sensor protein
MEELERTVELRRNGQPEAALAVVLTDHGKDVMDRIRTLNDEMQNG